MFLHVMGNIREISFQLTAAKGFSIFSHHATCHLYNNESAILLEFINSNEKVQLYDIAYELSLVNGVNLV